MTNLRQAAMLALQALEQSIPNQRDGDDDYCEVGFAEHRKALTALRKALEQPTIKDSLTVEPEQEPVASIYISQSGEREFDDWKCKLPIGRNLLYTTPPAAQQPWVGLTDDEILEAAQIDGADTWLFATAYAIEAKLKERNT